MNTLLIDDLAAQAWRYSLNYDGEEVLPQIKVFHRKLAELIVKDCIDKLYDVDGDEFADYLMDYFGVKPNDT
jgi:hypothetical protein